MRDAKGKRYPMLMDTVAELQRLQMQYTTKDGVYFKSPKDKGWTILHEDGVRIAQAYGSLSLNSVLCVGSI